MSKTHNAGIVTAYGAAVRGGYTGTYEEFCTQQAQYAENARQMEQAVSDVRQIKTSVESAVSEAEGYANNANQSATNASNSATQASESASNANQSAERASQSADNASSSASSASQSAASAQTSATNASTSEQNARQSAKTAQDVLESVQAEGNTQINRVQSEGNTQIGRIQAKGNEVLDSLPDDFTEVQKELESLNDSLANIKSEIVSEISNPPENWEIGNISVNAITGYTYNSSGRRIRTKDGVKYHLKQGNTVALKSSVELTKTDQTKETVSLQFWVSWYNPSTSKYEWRNYDSTTFTAPIDGDYVFVVHIVNEPDFLTIYTDAISVMSSALSIYGDSITDKMNQGFDMSNFTPDGATKFICRMGWDIYNASTPPQGSVASFKEAYKHGHRIMLADVYATSDSKFVVAHDDNISSIGAKNSDGTDISGTVNITESTLAQLDVYDFGIYKGSDYAGYKIPRLEDFLRFCKKYNCKIIFEMKDRSLSDEELQSFVSMINKYGLMDSIISVGYIRATDSEKFGLLFPNTPLWYDIGTLTEANINYVYNNRPSTGNYQWIYMLVNNTHPISDAVTQLTEFGEYIKSKGMGLGITELSTASELTALETGEVLSMLDYIAIKDISTYVDFLYS